MQVRIGSYNDTCYIEFLEKQTVVIVFKVNLIVSVTHGYIILAVHVLSEIVQLRA